MRYEFTEEQNGRIAILVHAMMFVALLLALSGLLGGVVVWLAGRQAEQGVPVVHLVESGGLVLLATALFAAAWRFRSIVTTAGNDVTHLLTAVGWLKWAYAVEILVTLVPVGLGAYGLAHLVGTR